VAAEGCGNTVFLNREGRNGFYASGCQIIFPYKM
jgi:hypothetical protein